MKNKKTYLARNFDSVVIMLGPECNLGCKYCMQKSQNAFVLPQKINEDIFGFLKQVVEESPFEYPMTLEFTGGEPTIHMDTIKKIIEKTNELGFSYTILTNGKLLTSELINYINSKKIDVHLSWDGSASKRTRGYDVMKDNINNVLKIDTLMLNAVSSSAAYPKEIIKDFENFNKEYKAVHGYRCGCNINFVSDPGIPERKLAEINPQKIYEDMLSLTKIVAKEKSKATMAYEFIKPFLWSFREKVVKKQPYDMFQGCGGGYVQLNLDLEGNLYDCHNTFNKVGNIHTPYFEYLSNVINLDSELPIRRMCKGCVAEFVCHDALAAGSCRLRMKDQEALNKRCGVMKAIATGVIHGLSDICKH